MTNQKHDMQTLAAQAPFQHELQNLIQDRLELVKLLGDGAQASVFEAVNALT